MSGDERITRPRLERSGPIRSWSGIMGTTRSEPVASVSDAVSSAVDLGYRVVDDYIRLGQRAAQQIGTRPFAPETAAGDLQELMTRMAQYTSDFLGVWSQFVDVAVGGGMMRGFPPPPSASPGVGSEAPVGSEAHDRTATNGDVRSLERTRVRIEVLSPLPTEVFLDLDPSAAARPATVQALRSVDASKPVLTGVALEPGHDGEPPRLTLRVSREQPTGVYSGVVVDAENSRLLGTLRVRIGEA